MQPCPVRDDSRLGAQREFERPWNTWQLLGLCCWSPVLLWLDSL